MSIDYDLRMNADWSPSQILDLLSETLKVQWAEGEKPILFSNGVILGAIAEWQERQSIMRSAFGFAPTVDVWFRINSRQDEDMGKRTLLRSVALLLDRFPGDVVLLFNGEHVVLQRLGGSLSFNNNFSKLLSYWPKSELIAAKLPYEWRSLTSPLL